MKNEPKKEKINIPEWLKTFMSYFVFVLLGIGIIVIMKLSGINTINISGESMAPTFHDKTMLVVKAHKHEREDIILFNPSSTWDSNTKKTYIKRIVALPGDVVKITGNAVYVNDKKVRTISEDYSKQYDVKDGKFVVPADKFFVMGDNHEHSNDSLYEYYNGNSDFLVDKNNVDFSGEKVFSFQYWFN